MRVGVVKVTVAGVVVGIVGVAGCQGGEARRRSPQDSPPARVGAPPVRISEPVRPPPLVGVDQLVAAEAVGCARRGPQVWCWGAPWGLGGGSDARQIQGLPAAVELDAQGRTICIRSDMGEVWCWGEITAPLEGTPGEVLDQVPRARYHDVPVRVVLPAAATAIAVGRSHACALVDGGALFCWGSTMGNAYGPGGGTVAAPARVASKITAVTAGYHWTCFATKAQARTCFGAVPPPGGEHLDNGGWLTLTCASGDLRVRCSGENFACLLGVTQQALAQAPVPVEIVGTEGASAMALGSATACVLVGDEVRCWGGNLFGQLDGERGQQSCVPTPRRVALSGPARAVVAAARFSCALVGEARGVACWGQWPDREDFGGVSVTPIGVAAVP